MTWWGVAGIFLAGALFGAFVGVAAIALMIANGRDDDE